MNSWSDFRDVIVIRHRSGRFKTFVLVDEADAARLSRYSWFLDRHGYAVRADNGVRIAMHREIGDLAPGDPRVVHHINEFKLDNRRVNLKICEASEHARTAHPRSRANGGHWHIEVLPGWPFSPLDAHALLSEAIEERERAKSLQAEGI